MTSTPSAQLSHIGLYVDDVDEMVRFYTQLVGFVVTDRGEFLGRQLAFLSRRADEHHQMALVTGRVAPEGAQILGQVSFAVDDLDALRHFRRRALELGATGIEGRNHGNSWSIYFEDPEGNRIEMYCPTPWYVSQPWRVPLDLDASNEEIERTTRKLIEESATWAPIEEWREQLAQRLESGAT